ncbi:alpha/beta fold hydrolase [Dactylosporangium sp. NPDC051485]|uniref:alpha/beta fold hydrolase n=1 Tax=Dactylosporangium sp. NPDC051485 TaxID=3154846 RepID=UPI0034494E14
MTVQARAVENEFADLLASSERPPAVIRRWVNVTAGGHVSAVVWGTAAPEIVLLHDEGADARTFDPLLSTVDRPAAALDLPGHGRSSGTPAEHPDPGRLARPVVEAIGSFAPRHRLVLARGLGARVALFAATRNPGAIARLVLVDSLPGPAPQDGPLWERLAALRHPPLLVRSRGGALTDAEVARFTQASPQASVSTVDDTGPATLAGIIDTALH